MQLSQIMNEYCVGSREAGLKKCAVTSRNCIIDLAYLGRWTEAYCGEDDRFI
jgi:hypothetical protein